MKKMIFAALVCCLSFATIVLAEDPDFGNTAATATEINVDTTIAGELTAGDEDWLVFTPTANTRYIITFFNPSESWRYFQLYADEGFDNLTHLHGANVYKQSQQYAYFFERSMPIYIRVYGNAGNYTITVATDDTYPSDGYGKNAAAATEIFVNNPAISGTLSEDEKPAYEDWFFFSTTALHQYRIKITQAATSSVFFQFYNSDGTQVLNGSTHELTVTSLMGEDFAIRVVGHNVVAGNYYELQVTDIASFVDVVGNSPDYATSISVGTQYTSSIDYESVVNADQDWFVFIPAGNARYQLNFTNPEYKWKYITVYQDKGGLTLTEVISSYVYFNQDSKDIFLNTTDPVYIKFWGNMGSYSFSVTQTEIFPPDSHSQNINAPTSIAVGSTTKGTISPDQTIKQDWFIVNTQPLRKYNISLYCSSNSNAHLQLYGSDNNQIYGNNRGLTFVSWAGQPYKIMVNLSSATGDYYELTITEIETVEDDYPNIISQAFEITKDGTEYAGRINYEATALSDEDWFKFLAPLDGNYQLALTSFEHWWIYFNIYNYNNVGQLVHKGGWGAYAGVSRPAIYLTAGMHYIKVNGNVGDYALSVLSPESRCGDLDHPYPAADANKDCVVDLQDFAIMASQWLLDNRPSN